MLRIPKILLVLVILLTGSLYLGSLPTQTVGQGSVDADVEAGDTYYYEITKFPTFNEILDLTGASDGFNETHSLSISGGLQGSQIYAKVMDVTQTNTTYWDGSSRVNAMVPSVDLSMGMITGQSLDVEIIDNGTMYDTTIPEGIGLPIPVLFTSTTVFNVSDWAFTNSFVPIPLVLSDDYTLHETIINQANANIPAGNGTLEVVNDASQFKIDFIDLVLSEDLNLDGLVSYKKPSGLAQEVNMVLTNTTTNEILVDIDIDLARELHNGMDVEVGDTFELSVSDATFSHDVQSSNQTIADDISAELEEVKANMSENIGEVLINFEVVEVRGLYYSVEGQINNGTHMVDFPKKDGYNDDIWFHSFGRLGPGSPLPIRSAGQTFFQMWNGTDYVSTDHRIPIRERALPGPFTTADYEIFQAWDTSLTYLVSLLNAELQNALNLFEDEAGVIEFSSSTSDNVEASVAFTSDSSSETYFGWELNADLDMVIWSNLTSTTDPDANEEFLETSIIADAAIGIDYNQTVMTGSFLKGNVRINITAYNDTYKEFVVISISDFIVELSTDTTVEPAPLPVTTTMDTTTTGSEDTDPSLPLPGFELVATVFAIMGVGLMVRVRSRKT